MSSPTASWSRKMDLILILDLSKGYLGRYRKITAGVALENAALSEKIPAR
jgi:hypothetical protein